MSVPASLNYNNNLNQFLIPEFNRGKVVWL